MNNSPETAASLLVKWNAAERDDAFVVGLSGHLGAGKTSFTKMIAKELGITETVTSPTFVIMKIYDVPSAANISTGHASADVSFKRLVHIDAYRLEKRAELEGIDFEQVASDPHNLVIVEWPENAGLTTDDMDEWLKLQITDGAYTIAN